MNIFRVLLNKSGFSLIEVTIAIGLLGLAGAAVVTLTDITNRDSRTAEMAFQKIDFFSSAEKFFLSKQACDELKTFGTFVTNKPLEFTKWKVAGNEGNPNLPMKAGRKFKNFEIKSIEASPINDLDKDVRVGMIDGYKANLKVAISLEFKVNQFKKSTSPTQIFKKEFFIPVTVDNDRQVLGCESDLVHSVCEKSPGLVFDPISKTCKPVNPNQYCFLSSTFAMRTSSGWHLDGASKIFVNTKTGDYTCPYGDQKVPTGAIGKAYDYSCGKNTCYNYWNVTYFSCIRCLSNVGGTSGGTTGGVSGGGGGGGGGGCFVAGTEISLFDGTKKAIEDVVIGDELLDVSGNKVTADELVRYAYEGPIYSINGGPYFFTPNHPFLTLDGWKSLEPSKSMKESPGLIVSKMKIGDVLIKSDGYEVILSLDSIITKETVYNFSVSGLHEYIANDYAVHNLIPVAKK